MGHPAEVLHRVHEDVVRHVGRQLGDDAAMLLLQYDPHTPAAVLPHQNGQLAHR